jgi:hypothetical protein
MNNWDSNYGILVPHGAGPTKIVAPRIDQKRVGSVKNHFHAYRNTVGAGDSTVLVQSLLNRHRLMTRTQMPRRSEEPRAAKTDSPSDFVFTEPQVLKGKGVEASKPSVTVVEELQPSPAPVQVVKVDEPVPTAPPATATPSKTKKSSKAKPTTKKVPVKVEPLHHVPSGELMPSFRAWVESLSWREVPLTVFRVREGGQDRVSKILFDRLPGALRHEHLAHWKQRNWVRVHGGKLGIVNTGCVVLCQKQIDAFMASPQAQVVEIGEGSERVVVKPRATSVLPIGGTSEGNQVAEAQAVDTPTTPPPLFTPEALKDPHVQAKVRSWIARHGCLLDGHPGYTFLRDLMQIPDKDLLGRYQPRVLYVTEAYLANLEGLPPETIKRFPSTTESIKGQKLAVREIPANVAMRLTPLKRLLSDDLYGFAF